MTTYRDASKLAAAQRARARRLQHGHTSIDAAVEEAAEIARAEAVKLTSGTTKAVQLAAAGHPFKKKRLLSLGSRNNAGKSMMGVFPLLPVNKQSGGVVKGWRVFKRSTSRGVTYRLQNIDPHAKYTLAPGGTKTVVDRGFWKELNRRVIPKARKKKLELFRAALKG